MTDRDRPDTIIDADDTEGNMPHRIRGDRQMTPPAPAPERVEGEEANDTPRQRPEIPAPAVDGEEADDTSGNRIKRG